MQKTLLSLSFLSLATCSFGQSTIEAMLQQIAALQTYAGAAEKGYRVTEQGLATIRTIRQGEYDLHTVYFQSLSTVNPAVKTSPGMAGIIRWQLAIKGIVDQSIKEYSTSPWLQPDERSYLQQVYGKIIDESQQDADAAATLTGDAGLQMDDGARLNRIAAIETTIGERYKWVQAFRISTDLLIFRRKQEGDLSGTLTKMYGL